MSPHSQNDMKRQEAAYYR